MFDIMHMPIYIGDDLVIRVNTVVCIHSIMINPYLLITF